MTHELRRSIEHANSYILLVQWQTLEDHTVGFPHLTAISGMEGAAASLLRSLSTVEHYEMPLP
jgi:hypothetical protein